MINKIRKYLLRHEEITPLKKNKSGSEYFQVSNSKIRLSNHISTAPSRPDQLNIIVNKDCFVAFLGNQLINVNDYELFKQYIKHHILICDTLKHWIGQGRNTDESNEESLQIEDSKEEDYQSKVIDGVKMFVADIPFKGDYTFNRKDMNENQLYYLSESQLSWIESKNFKSKEAATKYLKHIRTRVREQKA